MSWEPELDELRRREELARRMGGEERVDRQHASGHELVRHELHAGPKARGLGPERRGGGRPAAPTPFGPLRVRPSSGAAARP